MKRSVLATRAQQAAVLLVLQQARGRPLTSTELAHRLNAWAGLTGRESFDRVDVECSLSALAQRDGLAAALRAHHLAPPAPDATIPGRLIAPVLATAALVSACASAPQQPAPPLQSYFGGMGPVGRSPVAATQRVFAPVVGAGMVNGALLPTDHVPTAKATLTTATGGDAAVSYFASIDPAASAQAVPLKPTEPAKALVAAVPASNSPEPAPVRTADRATQAREAVFDDAPAAGVAPAPVQVAAQQQAAPVLSWYSDQPGHVVLTFAKNSPRVEDEAREQVARIVATLGEHDRIELRGRVGSRALSEEAGRLALARAISVRRELVAQGVTRERIRVRMPRAGDLLDHHNAASGINMSVSMVIVPRSALRNPAAVPLAASHSSSPDAS